MPRKKPAGSDMLQSHLFDDLPTTTVHQSRLQLCEPTKRPKGGERLIETPWGTARITGRLGQRHADVLEAVYHQAEDWRRLDDGRVQLLVDPYKVRRTAGGGTQASHEQLAVLIREILAVVVDLSIPSRGLRIMGHILEEVTESKVSRQAPKGALGGAERYLWRVTLARTFVELLGGDLHLHYDPTPIAALTYGVSQAVARHVMTHSQEPNGGWSIDGLIQAVGAGRSSEAMRNKRRELGKDAEGLRALGLVLEDGRLRRADPPKSGN